MNLLTLLALFATAAGLVQGGHSVAADTTATTRQRCADAGRPAWSERMRWVVARCENEIESPNNQFVVKVGLDGSGEVWRQQPGEQQRTLVGRLHLEPPGMIVWAPDSSGFALNDGEGSGLSSLVRVFSIRSARLDESRSLQASVVKAYRDRNACGPTTADPNVWAFGWSADASRLHLLVQATVNNACATPREFGVAVVTARDGVIREWLAPARAKRRFAGLLPRELWLR